MNIRAIIVAVLVTSIAWQLTAQTEIAPKAEIHQNLVIGPGDQIVVRALLADEFSDKPLRVQEDGTINLPLIGRVKAGGLTVSELEKELKQDLTRYYVDPQVTVTVFEFRSQPVSVVGAVATPGVQQLQGRKTLLEVLSLAGGPRPEAGPVIRVTRKLKYGRVPLQDSHDDPSGGSSVGELSLRELQDGNHPADNILVLPEDVISIPLGGVVYVIGEVKKSGGFTLGPKRSLSVLEALSLAEGLQIRAAPSKAKILHAKDSEASQREEVAVDVRRILAGKDPDLALGPSDILFIPSSATKNATLRSLETAIQIGTGLVIYHR